MANTYNKMTLGQLKAELTERELESSGKKSELVTRLVDHDIVLKEKAEAEKKAEEERIAQQEKEEAEAKKAAEEAAKKEAEEAAKREAEEAAKREAEEAAKEKDTEEIMDEIDTIIKDENGEDEKVEENGETEEKADEEKAEEEKEPEEPKVELKTEEYDFTKNAQGFVVSLDTGKNIVIPIKDTLKFDMKARRQSKTVLVYPLRIADLASGILQPFMEKCCHFYMNFHEHNHEKEKSGKGFIEFIFNSDEEAEEQADLLAEVSEDLVVRKLSRKDKPQDTYQDVPQELITVGVMVKRYVYIGNLPSTATEEDLQELFPESINIAIICNDDDLPKGYAYAEYKTEEEVKEVVKKSLTLQYPGYENKLVLMRTWAKIPKGVMESSARKDLLDKIRNLRRLRMKNTDDMARNRLENEMALLKMKLDKDCRVRSEWGLPEPPDIVRQAEARAAVAARRDADPDKKTGTPKSGSSISTISRGGRGRPGITRGTGRFSAQSTGRGNFRGGMSRGGMSRGGMSRGGLPRGGMGRGRGAMGSSRGGGQGMNQAVEMLMQVSKMLGTGPSRGGGSSYNQGGGSYGNQSSGGGGSYGNSTSSYGGSTGRSYGGSSGSYGGQSSGGYGGSGGGSYGGSSGGGSYGGSSGGSYGGSGGGSYGGSGGSYGGSSGNSGSFFKQNKRSGDSDGYGGGGKRSTSFYNNQRW